MAVSIIPTKIIIPKRAPGVIQRARLLDYLHENLGRKLMLVTAPAGYGKTTLLVYQHTGKSTSFAKSTSSVVLP